VPDPHCPPSCAAGDNAWAGPGGSASSLSRAPDVVGAPPGNTNFPRMASDAKPATLQAALAPMRESGPVCTTATDGRTARRIHIRTRESLPDPSLDGRAQVDERPERPLGPPRQAAPEALGTGLRRLVAEPIAALGAGPRAPGHGPPAELPSGGSESGACIPAPAGGVGRGSAAPLAPAHGCCPRTNAPLSCLIGTPGRPGYRCSWRPRGLPARPGTRRRCRDHRESSGPHAPSSGRRRRPRATASTRPSPHSEGA
jgi:hypothetical protein